MTANRQVVGPAFDQFEDYVRENLDDLFDLYVVRCKEKDFTPVISDMLSEILWLRMRVDGQL